MKTRHEAILIIAALALAAAAFLAVSQPSLERVSYALSSTVIEHLAVTEVHISVALSVIEAEFRHQHPEMRDVQLITRYYTYPPELDTSPYPLVTLDLRKIPADEALRYLAELTDYRFVVFGGSIYFGDRYRPVTLSERLAAQRRELFWHIQGLANR